MSSIEKAMQRQSAEKKPNQDAQGYNKIYESSRDIGQKSVPSNRPVCSLNLRELERQGYLTPDASRTKLAEEYRAIKRPLLQNAFGKGAVSMENGNVIVVVSALPGEGKTFTAFNLAMSMAMEKDTTVLLVDGDILKCSLTEMLKLRLAPGLTDVLASQNVNLGEVIVNTEISKLSVLPAGQGHLHTTELLASSNMERVVNELAQRYADRIVIFDAPPLLVTSEAPILTKLAGQVLVVVEAGKTTQQVIGDAVSLLDTNKVIGMVLNKSRGSLGSDYYGQGYRNYGQ
jgi:exopolysaccharide/PEP-CTERM locus tyrosine autokinase